MSHVSTFVSRRFEEVHALLNARGYLLDFGGRELPRWADDPPLGLIHIRAVLLPDADEDEDADPDERISFTLTERWSEHPVGEAQDREWLYLCSYSYHGAGRRRSDPLRVRSRWPPRDLVSPPSPGGARPRSPTSPTDFT
ncbi:MAG TPA: hypothetical protein VNY52_10395 [Solirubrobacteraceae bacterium]|nr:hypothetical protein [Solirubrobacteraceae bacterium]